MTDETQADRIAGLANDVATRLYERRVQGVPWSRLARDFDCTETQAQEACREIASRDLSLPLADTLREEMARLDRLLAAVWPGAMQKDPLAIREARGIMADRAKYLGLYAKPDRATTSSEPPTASYSQPTQATPTATTHDSEA